MGGIVMPITLSAGKQAALRDNRADARAARDDELTAMRMTGLQMQQARDQRAMDEDAEEAPIRKMKRDAEKIAQIAKFGAANLDRVADEDVPAYVAKVMSEMPAYGSVEVRDGKLFDGEKTIPMGRAEAEKLLSTFADPDTALKLKMAEGQYVGKDGKVVTTTAADAGRQGLSRATDVKAGYELGKAEVDSRYAEQDALAGLDAKKAAAAHSRAATARSQQEKQAQYTDGKTVQTMTPEEAKAKGMRLVSDFNAERKLQGGDAEPYDFSKQSPDAAAKYAQTAHLEDKGYHSEEFYNEDTGTTTKKWLTADGKPVPAEDLQEAVAVSRDTVGLLSSGHAKNADEAYRKATAYRADMALAKQFAAKAQQAVAEKRAIVLPSGESKVFTDPQEAMQAIIAIYQKRQAELGKAKEAGAAAMRGPQGASGSGL